MKETIFSAAFGLSVGASALLLLLYIYSMVCPGDPLIGRPICLFGFLGWVAVTLVIWREMKRDEALERQIRIQSMVRYLLGEAVRTDGAHHKQWYLEQVAQHLGVQLPEHEPGKPQ